MIAIARPGRRRRLGRSNAQGYLWLAPAFLIMGAILAYPIVQDLIYSFTDRSAFGDTSFVGLDNYRTLVEDDLFWRSFRNNLLLLLSVPIVIAIALVASAIMYRGIVLHRTIETALFLPFLPAVASAGMVFVYLLAVDGPLNSLLRTIGLDGLAQPWLTQSSTAIWAVMLVVVWKRIGFTVLLFTTRLLGLNQELFDAAAVDGASWRRTFRHVALPQMRSIIQFAAVLGFIEVFAWTFAYVFVMTNGGPDQASFTLELYLYRTQFQEQLAGLAAAVAALLLLAAGVVAVYRVRTSRRQLEAA